MEYVHLESLLYSFLDIVHEISKHFFVYTEWLRMSSIQYRVVTEEKLIPSSVLGAFNMSNLIKLMHT